MKKSDVKNLLTHNQDKYKYTVDVTNSFKKDFVNCCLSGRNPSLLIEAVEILATEGKLPPKYKPHALQNNMQGFMECHIQPDWLLVWKQENTTLTLLLTNTGSHAYIFGW